MKKLYIILFVISVTNCTNPYAGDLADKWEVVIDDWLLKSYPFDVFDYINAPQGWNAEWETTLTFIANDPPGWKFVNWNLPSGHSYCVPNPVVDSKNPRKQVIFNSFKNMDPCNMALEIRSITPNFIKIEE